VHIVPSLVYATLRGIIEEADGVVHDVLQRSDVLRCISFYDKLGDPKRFGTRLVVRPSFKPSDAVLQPYDDHKDSL
jgi:hypothetical protein